MGAPDVLRHLREAGFTVAPVDGGGIKVAPSSSLTDAQRQAIRDHRAELLLLLAPPIGADPDRCCWPHSDAMNGTELERLTARARQFTRQGASAEAAEAMADRLVARDREMDGRRACVECSSLSTGGRCLQAQRGRLERAGRQLEPVQTLLHRCEAFELRKGLQ